MKRRRIIGKQAVYQDAALTKKPWFAYTVRSYLEVADWCKTESLSRHWQEHSVGVTPWRDLYLDRFGLPSWMPESSFWSSLGDRRVWKFNWFREMSFRIVPGQRAAGVLIGDATNELRTKHCDTIVPFWDVPEYVSPGQGYRFLDFKVPGGPVKRMEHSDRADRGLPSMNLPIVCEENDDSEFDTQTEFTEQFLTIWTWKAKVSTIGVHSHCFGVLEIPERPEIKGIRVGITCEQLLDKLGVGADDIYFDDSNPGGPVICFDQLHRVRFEVDAANGGLAEVDCFTCYQDIHWLRPRLHYPIGAIFIC